MEESVIHRLLTCLLVLTSIFSSSGASLAVQLQQPSPARSTVTIPVQAAVNQALRASPVMFIENVGQFAEGARFQVGSEVSTMWLAEDALWITAMTRSEKARPGSWRPRRLAYG